MFCRNCGKELAGAPEICMNCGAKPMAGTGFCARCGTPTTSLTEVCTNCGAQVAGAIKEKTWKPTAAGILCIIVGTIGAVTGILVTLVGLVLMGDTPRAELSIDAPIIKMSILGGIAIIIAIVGGTYALKRRVWGLALAGSICALFCIPIQIYWIFASFTILGMLAGFTILAIPGILAIIFVIRGKREFECGATVAKELAGDISPKSRRATTLLTFFLGVFGAHRFYIGKTRTAIVMLLLSIAGLGIAGRAIMQGGFLGFLGLLFGVYAFSILIAVGIWAFVDFIFAVTGRIKDKEGRLIQKW